MNNPTPMCVGHWVASAVIVAVAVLFVAVEVILAVTG